MTKCYVLTEKWSCRIKKAQHSAFADWPNPVPDRTDQLAERYLYACHDLRRCGTVSHVQGGMFV
ncbi:MAG TPA: hypothetical protein IAB84_12445 [Candidatus Choladousia intestinigallinarum]|nr:hypothetical protein [Candidatus Choladousia intestinigallinarum]